jgi:hypothetical protein
MQKRHEMRLIMMVAQRPFQTADLNQFCKLLPMIYVDGSRPEPVDFPNDGEIWWMLNAQTARLANPGQLVVGLPEPAVRYDENDPESSRFQVERESVQELSLKDALEIIALPADAFASSDELLSGELKLHLPERPAPPVLLKWRSHLYGPFISTPVNDALGGEKQFAMAPANTIDMSIFRIDENVFNDAARDAIVTLQDRVSLLDDRRRSSQLIVVVRHTLVLRMGYERVLATNPVKLIVEPLDKKLVRLARDCLSRKKRQELQGLLSELAVASNGQSGEEELAGVVARVRQLSEKQEAALDLAVQALLKSGWLGEDRLARAEKSAAEKYVLDRSAELQAEAEKARTEHRAELKQVKDNLKRLKEALLMEETASRTRVRKELEAEKARVREELAQERKKLDKQKDELAQLQKMLKSNLETVTKEWREAGNSVVNRFLEIAPFLGFSGGLGEQAGRTVQPQTAPVAEKKESRFDVPAYALGNTSTYTRPLTEEAFFQRFCRVVEESGFTYRLLDLQRFHLSVKCSDITMLGGPSGTGKSSLPLLYSRALMGDEVNNGPLAPNPTPRGRGEGGEGRPDCLMINVNPAWMDARDLLGHVNSMDGRFYPAESGLFEHLAIAQEEHRNCGTASAMYLACLDEMNLSQVEHYFSDFMMVLERTGSARQIQCFSAQSVGTDCPFKPWARIALSPALRFVGTVNFDETTRLLSDRFLDRANLIRLQAPALPRATGSGGALASVIGRMATVADFQSWCTDGALPADLALLLDQIRPTLTQIGCPISPRVYRGVCRTVCSAAAIMSPARAFDTQLAQRIIPRIRSLVTKQQFEALDQLLEVLKQNNAGAFEESIAMLEDVRESASMRSWRLED